MTAPCRAVPCHYLALSADRYQMPSSSSSQLHNGHLQGANTCHGSIWGSCVTMSGPQGATILPLHTTWAGLAKHREMRLRQAREAGLRSCTEGPVLGYRLHVMRSSCQAHPSIESSGDRTQGKSQQGQEPIQLWDSIG